MPATYGSLNLTATSPVQSFTEPISIQELKDYLNLPERSPADADEDTMLEAFITAARAQAEIAQGRDLVRKQWDLSLDAFFAEEIELRDPLVSVDLVQHKDSDGLETALAADTDYIVDTAKHPGIVRPAYGESWPSFTAWPSSAVTIRFTSGYASTDVYWSGDGKLVRKGMLMLCSAWFHGRLPFEAGIGQVLEFPYAVTSCLSHGRLERAR